MNYFVLGKEKDLVMMIKNLVMVDVVVMIVVKSEMVVIVVVVERFYCLILMVEMAIHQIVIHIEFVEMDNQFRNY